MTTATGEARVSTNDSNHKETDMAREIYRQGDVLIVRTDCEAPATAQPVKPAIEGRHVLAYGEATGHHHSVAVKDAELLQDAEAVYLRIMSTTTLDHQEHSAITLEPGTYRVVRQREYVPDALPSWVAD